LRNGALCKSVYNAFTSVTFIRLLLLPSKLRLFLQLSNISPVKVLGYSKVPFRISSEVRLQIKHLSKSKPHALTVRHPLKITHCGMETDTLARHR